MTDNHNYLAKAETFIKEFESENEPERLREAYLALCRVDFQNEKTFIKKGQVRITALSMWLTLLNILDTYYDPSFDRSKKFVLKVQPPPASDGTIWPPGSDPELIEDPVAREDYIKAIAENNKKIKNYSIQVKFSRLNDSLPARAIHFIQTSYSSTPEDQLELKATFDTMLKNPGRQTEFLKLLVPLIH